LIRDMEPNISYIEKPVTTDEKQIAALLEQTVTAINTKNLSLLQSVYAEDATVRMSTNKLEPMTLQQYLARLPDLIYKVRHLRMGDIIIHVNDPEAKVLCVSSLLFHGALNYSSNRRYFKFLKRDGEWRIIEAGYYDY